MAILKKLALKDELIQAFFENVDEWIHPDRPSVHEMNSICFEAGTINQAMTDQVVKGCTNLKLMDKRVKRIMKNLRRVIDGDG